ncbi:MAG: DinB family protein [Thermoanaerobaculia bacterium]
MPTTPSSSTTRTYGAIRAQLDELLVLAGQPDLAAVHAQGVSGWSVGGQLEHLLLSDRMILDGFDTFLDGTLTSAGGGPTAIGRFILLSGYIPRGKGRAPKGVVPGDLSPSEIASGFAGVKKRFEELAPRLGELEASRATYRHPLLGDFNPGQWLKFVKVHHHHHQKLIRDIRRLAERSAA